MFFIKKNNRKPSELPIQATTSKKNLFLYHIQKIRKLEFEKESKKTGFRS